MARRMIHLFFLQLFSLARSRIELSEIIGEGQFGDVHRGVYRPATAADTPPAATNIAVKTCKVETDACMAEKFLEEAYIMQQFDHQHIIKLIGGHDGHPAFRE
jgi:focal adhesion kinase 1